KYMQIYCEAAYPVGLAHVGLRYVNQIELPYEDVELEDYFSVLPQIPNPIPQIFPSFLLQVDIPYAVPKSGLRIIFGTIKPEISANLAYAMDLAMYSVNDAVPTTEQVAEWLDIAHGRIEAAFDAAFTKKTHREIFKEVNM